MSSAAKVWLVVGYNYEDTYIESIWTTKEAADKHLAEFTTNPSYASYSFGVEEHELRTEA